MDVIIEEARLSHLRDVMAAYEWLLAPPGVRPDRWDAELAAAAVRRAIESDSAAMFIAVAEQKVVGLCSAYEDIESVRFGRRVWVEDLAVHPDHRSLGIGKLLLDRAKEWARGRGADRLVLESSVARADAHRFYERERPDSRALSFGWWL